MSASSIPLRRVKARNFRSLTEVDVEFGAFNVLVGPNGSGKSNLLKVLEFVRDTSRFDIRQAIDIAGGFDRVLSHAQSASSAVELTVEGRITAHSTSRAPDSYRLVLEASDSGALKKEEVYQFKRVPGQGRRYKVTALDDNVEIQMQDRKNSLRLASENVSALGALARVDSEDLGTGPSEFFAFLSSVRYLDPIVREARRPSRISNATLDDDATNLASALYTLYQRSNDAFEALIHDLRRCLPGLETLTFDHVGGSRDALVVQLIETGLREPIDLADASFGTVRILALLVALHEPSPPALTIIEEVDHGLHPYALDVLVDRMREASTRTQIIVASHSPTLVNRLAADEMIVCDRDPVTGGSVIPSIAPDEIRELLAGGGRKLGELWFAGSLGGVPQ
ncbi:MAG: AAA family ATPase [Gordonia sp. (in: high G+C Gram-positive bacteria)]|uniref:AAA family ATPase n=1 Tax=Gordonia TaxID=2053 RepID=UPI0032651EE5